MTDPSIRRGILLIVATFGVVFAMSQFFRTANAVLAKELSEAFALSPESLGILTGTFFLAFGAAQIPMGVLFDRYGARRTVPVMLGLTVLGSLIFGFAGSFATLMAGRALIGLGVAGVLMGSLFLFGRWAPPERFATWMGRMIALGGIGGLLATTPLAFVAETLGWRSAFFGAAAITALGAALVYALVRDAPPGHAAHTRPPETLRQSLAGIGTVLVLPGLSQVLGMALASYPVVITLLGLWGGPYLADVHGLDKVASGNVLLIMALALIGANLVIGPLERRLDTRKWVVVGAAACVVLALALLALLPGLALWQATALFAVVGACGSFNVVVASHGRSLFPDRLAGRGMALVAIALMGGPALMQSVSGVIVGAFPAPGGAAPEAAYRAVFGFLALVVTAALANYLRLADAKPSAGFAA